MADEQKYVVYGYMAKCSEGSLENYISTDKGHGVLYQGQPILNANDHHKDVNQYKAKDGDGFFTKAGKLIVRTATKVSATVQEVAAFDKCKLDTPLPWMFANGRHMLDGAPAITEESQCGCRYGGIITIVPAPDEPEGGEEVSRW